MPPTTRPLQDPAAFTELFEQHHLAVFRFIFGLSGGALHEVEDLTAETFLRAWRSRQRFEGDINSALGWLLTIARHLVIDASRRKKVRKHEQFIVDLDDWQAFYLLEQDESVENQAIRHEQISQLLRNLNNLPAARRELLILRYILGWQVKQIAAHLGILENTASVYLHRAIEQIRREWPSEDL
jgi:RNA polymerase sigma-70 factor (ECF subfamily)